MVVERTDTTNSLRVTVEGLLKMDVKVTPIGEEESRVHNYQLPPLTLLRILSHSLSFQT